MDVLGALLLLPGFVPLAWAWQRAADLPLRTPVTWTLVAWVGWCLHAFATWPGSGLWGLSDLSAYLALCLTGCAGVAVLGARRPGVGAWNFVVAGLLAALLLPVAQGLGRVRLEGPQLIFLACVLAIALFNYLPTRLAGAALALGAGCAVEVGRLAGAAPGEGLLLAGRLLLAAAPWLGLLALRGRRGEGVDDLWRDFRDRHGFLWAQRTREQFNRAAENAGLPVVLTWGGLQPVGEGPLPEEQALILLRALLRRFGSPEGQ